MATHKTVDEVREKASQTEFKFHGRDQVKKKGAYEKADPIPVAPPVGYVKQPPHLWEQIRQANMILELEKLVETEEDADDFLTPDDPDSLPESPWENDTVPDLKTTKARKAELIRRLEAEGFTYNDETGELVQKAPPTPAPSSEPRKPAATPSSEE